MLSNLDIPQSLLQHLLEELRLGQLLCQACVAWQSLAILPTAVGICACPCQDKHCDVIAAVSHTWMLNAPWPSISRWGL